LMPGGWSPGGLERGSAAGHRAPRVPTWRSLHRRAWRRSRSAHPGGRRAVQGGDPLDGESPRQRTRHQAVLGSGLHETRASPRPRKLGGSVRRPHSRCPPAARDARSRQVGYPGAARQATMAERRRRDHVRAASSVARAWAPARVGDLQERGRGHAKLAK
jgi:hypothetical protein